VSPARWRLQSSQTSRKALQKAYSPVLDEIGVSADNEHMRRFAILGVCLLAGLTLPQVALGAPALVAHNCGSNCGSLEATGKGTLNVNGNGAEWGSIASGTVKVQDKSHNGRQDWSLTGCDKRFKDESNKAITVCQANNTIYFNASTVWWISLNGTGVSASIVASGGFYIKGSGGYYLNDVKRAHRKSWPSGGKFFTF
jgi:hypothetical protein